MTSSPPYQHQTERPITLFIMQQMWIKRHFIVYPVTRIQFTLILISPKLGDTKCQLCTVSAHWVRRIDWQFSLFIFHITSHTSRLMKLVRLIAGFSVRAVLSTYANNNSSLFKAVKARFTKPAIPGQTLKVSLWRNGQRIHFKTTIAETGVDIITGAYVDLKSVITRNNTAASSPSLASDAVFAKIKDRINEDPERAKKINAVFLYHITKSGKPVKKWGQDDFFYYRTIEHSI